MFNCIKWYYNTVKVSQDAAVAHYTQTMGIIKTPKIETKEAIKQGVFFFGGLCILSKGEKTTTTFVFFPDSH